MDEILNRLCAADESIDRQQAEEEILSFFELVAEIVNQQEDDRI